MDWRISRARSDSPVAQRARASLAALAAGHPGVGQHAAHPEAGDDEAVPALLDAGVGRGSRYGAAEDRVVPVHRVAVLVEEALGVAADRVGQRPGRQLPVGLRLLAALGDGQRTAQRLVDRGGAGQQRVGHRGAVGLPLPADLAAGLLEPEHELDRRVDRGPHPVDERVVAGGEVVVPDADGDVRAEVALQAAVRRLLRIAVVVGGVPGAVGVLVAGEPLVGAGRGLVFAGRVQGHRGLGVVPRVEVVPAEPGQRPVLPLYGGDRGDRLGGLGRRQDTRQNEVFGLFGGAHASAFGRCGLRRTRRSSCRRPG